MGRKAHWTPADFVVTRRDAESRNRYGYCAKCGADMQSLGGEPPRHYHSHINATRAGVNWKALLGAGAQR